MSNTTDLQYGDELIIQTSWFKLLVEILITNVFICIACYIIRCICDCVECTPEGSDKDCDENV